MTMLAPKILLGMSVLAALGGLLGGYAPKAHAEGSQDIVGSGGSRPYLEFRNDSNGDILRRTIIKVYAEAGETIDLGSSAVGIGNGAIRYRTPNNVTGNCPTTEGIIATQIQEAAGPGDGSANTFIPCTVAVTGANSGIWEIDFISPDIGSGSNPPPISSTDAWDQIDDVGYVSAWDVTVRSSTGTPIDGRVYANYYAFNMGGNRNGITASSEFTVLTKEGYQYRLDLNSLDPFGFILFANRNGFFDDTTGDSIFRSLQLFGGNPGQLPPGFGLHNPNLPDTGIYITHKTFINQPDASMPSMANSPTGPTWLYTLPVAPPIPSDFLFTGIEGTLGQAGTTPLGGTFSFNSVNQNAFSITIDLNGNNTYGDANDRTFVGRSVVGANSIFWDGLDGNGDSVPPSSIPYNVSINQYAGEAHFPIIDAEQNNSGIILERINLPAGPVNPTDNPFNIYYDDRNTGVAEDFSLCSSASTETSTTDVGLGGPGSNVCYGGPPTPREALNGVNSFSGRHEFTNNFGNRRGIDTWVYYPSLDVPLSGGIVVKEADLTVVKDVDLLEADPGEDLEYTITITNDGPSDSLGITFRDVVPSVLSNVAWTCSITDGVGSCGEDNGSGNTIETTLDLNNQAEATYVVTGTISGTASGTITNEGAVVRNNDITDPDLSNNTDNAQTDINDVPPPIGAFCYAVANSNNRLVQVDINTGAEAVVGPVGPGGAIRAIAYRNRTNELFVANNTQLGVYDTFTNGYSVRGSFGSVGPAVPTSVDGLAFHPFTGELYGVARNNSGSDSLIKIDPSSGAFIPDAFGPGVDFLTITVANSNNIGDIAFDTITGELYGIANRNGTNSDRLVKIDVTDGSTTIIGDLGVNLVKGLAAFNDGSFYGTTITNTQPTAGANTLYRIDRATGLANSVGSGLTEGTNYESIACSTEAENTITGTVFLDPDTSGSLNAGDSGTPDANVRLYRDINGNGQVDGSDIFLVSRLSTGAGTFDFTFPANGSFVLDVEPASLPPANSVFTTDNVEIANFGTGFGLTDSGNDYGHFTNANLALVKRITAINGTSLPDSVDNPSDDDDNHPNWPSGQTGAGISTFLAGATQRGVEPGDVVEYTIYYLATGNFPVTNVLLCDRIPDGATYIPDSMVLFTNSVTSNLSDSDIDNDGAEFLPIGDPTALPCNQADTGGTVLVNLAQSPDQLPNATGPGTPTNAYGFIRFRVTVD